MDGRPEQHIKVVFPGHYNVLPAVAQVQQKQVQAVADFGYDPRIVPVLVEIFPILVHALVHPAYHVDHCKHPTVAQVVLLRGTYILHLVTVAVAVSPQYLGQPLPRLVLVAPHGVVNDSCALVVEKDHHEPVGVGDVDQEHHFLVGKWVLRDEPVGVGVVLGLGVVEDEHFSLAVVMVIVRSLDIPDVADH